MPFEAGRKLAHYEIAEPIGRGGMGEVYRAKDSKLGRDVAIKVLPDEFAQDRERLRRFQREAKVLASLNHPNIAAIYGLEHTEDTDISPDGQKFLMIDESGSRGDSVSEAVIVLNWHEELQRLVPTGR